MYFILAILLSLISILLTRLKSKNIILVISYLFFFISPILSYFGVIGVLTGFDSIGSNGIYFGISFYTVNISYHLLKNKFRLTEDIKKHHRYRPLKLNRCVRDASYEVDVQVHMFWRNNCHRKIRVNHRTCPWHKMGYKYVILFIFSYFYIEIIFFNNI